MAPRFSILTLAACLAAMTAPSAVSDLMPDRVRVQAVSGNAQLRAFGGRSALQRHSATAGKFDAALADLTRHAGQANPAHVLADLHSMSPAARFTLAADGSPLVLIDAVTRGDPQQLRSALQALGLERSAVYSNDVSGWLPIGQLTAAAARSEVHSMRASLARTRSGAVTSQGDFVQNSAALRTSSSLTAAGVTVGVLSDSFNCYATYAQSGSGVPASGYAGYAFNGFLATAATDVATGDLPASVNVVSEATCLDYGAPLQPPFGDEGRAMLQIVHDVAPGAALAFYTAENGEAAFATGIGALATAGATIIADDVGYFDEPFFQDGIIAQAIDAVAAKGVVYFSAAGNDGNASYDNTAPSFATKATTGSNAGEYLLNFDTTRATTTTALPITVDALAPGELLAVIVEWDQPYVTGAPDSGGASSRIDLCITGATNEYTIINSDGDSVTCTGANASGVDPVQILIIANPASASASTPKETLNLMIGLADGTRAPGRVKLSVATDGQKDEPITTFATNSSTLQGHPGAAGAAAVGAAFYFDTPACGTTPAVVESYSSLGGTPILFDSTGTRLATPLVRQRPNFVAPDGGNDTFLGFTLAAGGITGSSGQLSTSIAGCQNNASYPNFFGTSAATPHVASIAALMLQANPALTPAQIDNALQSTALAMNGSTQPNYLTGYGLIQANAAFATLPAVAPPAPTLSATSTSIIVGTSATLTWSSINATSCLASGSWSGTQAANGSVTVSGTAVGSQVYTLVCVNSAGTSSPTSVTIAVLPLPTPVATITAAAPSIIVGASTTVTWTSTNAASCAASGSWSGMQATSGTVTVSGSAVGTLTYTLTCTNGSGTSSPASATVTVLPLPAPVVTITAAAPSITVGQATTVTWTSTNAITCAASGSWSGAEATSGTVTVSGSAVGTLTYTLTCTNSAGSSSPASATVAVAALPAPVATIAAAATSIIVGASTTLTWSSTNATSCAASGSWSGMQATAGTLTVSGSSVGTLTYTLTCSNSTETSSPASATVAVTAAPSSGGHSGGGGLESWQVALLAALAAGTALRRRAAVSQ